MQRNPRKSKQDQSVAAPDVDLRIDENALDVEWLNQADLFRRYADLSANARLQSDLAKEHVDFVTAQAATTVRDNPDDFGLIKITEAGVKEAVAVHKSVVEARKAMHEAKHRSELLNNIVRALDQRKSALENLVRLHGQSYFAGPSVPRDLEENVLEHQRRTGTRDSVRKSLKKMK